MRIFLTILLLISTHSAIAQVVDVTEQKQLKDVERTFDDYKGAAVYYWLAMQKQAALIAQQIPGFQGVNPAAINWNDLQSQGNPTNWSDSSMTGYGQYANWQ